MRPGPGPAARLVATKLADAQARIAELVTLSAELQRARSALERHRPEGPCDDQCGCSSDPAATVASVSLVAKPTAEADVPIACTLSADAMPGRMGDWQRVLGFVRARTPVEDGVRLDLDPTAPFDEFARLAGAEQDCCRFFSFALTVDHAATDLRSERPPMPYRSSTPCSEPWMKRSDGAAVVGVGVAACAVCCAGPILGFLAAIGLGTVLGVAVFGIIGVVIALLDPCAPPAPPASSALRAAHGGLSRAAHGSHAIMTTTQLGRVVAALLVVAAVLFSAGAFYERSEDDHHETAEATEASAEGDAAEGAEESEQEEKLLGVEVESPWLIGLGALASLTLAALAWFAPKASTFTAITVVAVVFVIIGVAEVARKVDASEAGIALLAALVAGLHAAAAVLSVVASRQGRRQAHPAQPAS